MGFAILGGTKEVLYQAPGKALTIIGPFVLFRKLQIGQYAQFEAAFAVAAIIAIVAAGGLAAALPFDILERGSLTIWKKMRRRFTIYFVVTLGVSFLLIVIDLGQEKWHHAVYSAINVLALTCGLVGQNYCASLLRLQNKQCAAAICEHSGWLATIISTTLLDVQAEGENVLPFSIIGFQFVNILFIAFLLNRLSVEGLGEKNSSQMIEMVGGKFSGYSTPFMLTQFSGLITISVSRVVLNLIENPTASAYSALVFRMATPMLFIYQSFYSAKLSSLFQKDKAAADIFRKRFVFRLLWSSFILMMAICLIDTFLLTTLSSEIRHFSFAFFLAVQTVALFGCCEILALEVIGTESHKRFGKITLLGALVHIFTCALLTRIFSKSDDLVISTLFVGWAIYALIFFHQVVRQWPRLIAWKIVGSYFFACMLITVAISAGIFLNL